MSEAVELEPCPFCGSDGVASVHPEIDTMHIAGCSDADCIAAYVAYDFTSRDTAIAAWNRRALTGEAEPVACPACDRGEVFGLSTDDGFWVEMGASAGGAHEHGMNGWLELIEHNPDGTEKRREYVATDSPLYTRPPVAWPDREAVARALHARYEERARQRGQIGGDGYTVLGGARLEDCSRSLRQSFLEDADAVLSLLSEADRLRALVDVATGGLMLLGQADDGYKNEGKGRFCDGYAEGRCGMAEAARSLLTKLKGEGQ